MIYIDRHSKEPVYEQIYNSIKEDILGGTLGAGTYLPATRKLALDLSVSRNTVDTAYQQLLMEGYISSRIGAGHVVNDLSLLRDVPVTDRPAAEPQESGRRETVYRYDFGTGRADASIFPMRAWRRHLCEQLERDFQRPSFRYPDMQGTPKLRQAICWYLAQAKGIHCDPEDVVITSGQNYSIEKILGILDLRAPVVAMEDPGYHSARDAFVLHRCRLRPVPVEEDGIRLDALARSGARLLYVTPSHQFPLGAILSIKKRISVLEWAKQNDAYVVEDDYDSELRYNAMPVPPLRSIDVNNRVIYTGSFSKTLLPGICVAYIVLPPQMRGVYRKRYASFHNSVPGLVQNALADFILSGDYGRHIDRLRVCNRRKNAVLLEELERVFGPRASVIGSSAGHHIFVELHTDMTEQQLLDSALKRGIKLHSASKYWLEEPPAWPRQIMMGYGGIQKEDIPPAIELLHTIWFGESAQRSPAARPGV